MVKFIDKYWLAIAHILLAFNLIIYIALPPKVEIQEKTVTIEKEVYVSERMSKCIELGGEYRLFTHEDGKVNEYCEPIEPIDLLTNL